MAWCSQARALLSVKPTDLVRLLIRGGFALFVYLLSSNAYGADLQQVLTRLSNVIVPLTSLVLVFSYIAGITFIFKGIVLFKKFGTTGMSQAQPGEFSGPLMKIIIGAILIYLPTSTDILMNSLFTTGTSIFSSGSVASLSDYTALGAGSSLLSYGTGDSLSATWQSLADTLVLYIQFLGLISFLKGWFIMSHSTGQGAQPGSFSKGLTHIIGGIIALNFVGVVNIINTTIYGG
jgi:hypothetical protein